MNVASLFARHAAATPGAMALTWDEGSMTYGELRDLAQRTALFLESRRIGPGVRVGILLPNHSAFAVALLGTHWVGATAAVLSPAWSPADAARALAVADVRLLITTQALAEAIGVLPADTLLVDDGPALGALGRELARITTRAPAPAVRASGDVATCLFSSGTTGDPKGVVLTHGNLVFNARAKGRYCGITAADRLALVVPMSHCFGQNVVLLGALAAGASVRLFPRFDAERTVAAVVAGEVSMLLAAPVVFQRLIAGGMHDALRAVRYALTAAAAPAAGLGDAWRAATGRPLSQGYGLTECSPFVTYTPRVTGDGRGVGTAIDDVRVAVVGADGGRRAVGEAGEVVVRGPNVMQGYWRRPAATAEALRDGWLHTGDVGYLDDQGRLTISDRMDDVINVAGFKAWPSDVERAIAGHPAVREVAAYALPDPGRGAVVAAALVLHDGVSADTDEILRHASRRLAGFQRPSHLRVVTELPRSPGGKVLRRTLASADQRARHVTPANTDRPATALPAPSR